jgi:hypothetical protein
VVEGKEGVITEHWPASFGLVVIFGLAVAATVARVVGRAKSKDEDQGLKERELRALAEDQLKQAKRGER